MYKRQAVSSFSDAAVSLVDTTISGTDDAGFDLFSQVRTRKLLLCLHDGAPHAFAVPSRRRAACSCGALTTVRSTARSMLLRCPHGGCTTVNGGLRLLPSRCGAVQPVECGLRRVQVPASRIFTDDDVGIDSGAVTEDEYLSLIHISEPTRPY